MRLITSVPEIGMITGASFVVEIDDISRFKNAYHLASYVGLIPMCHSSGEKQGVVDITIRKDPAMTLAYEGCRKRMNANKAILRSPVN